MTRGASFTAKVLLFLLLTLTLVAVGCTSRLQVVVLATEYRFIPSEIILSSGQILIQVQNVGNASHELRLENRKETVLVRPGERKVLRLDLPSGTYRYVCLVHAHDELGMVGDLRISSAR